MNRFQKQPSVPKRRNQFAIHLFGLQDFGAKFLKRLETSLDGTSYAENDYGGEELLHGCGVIAYSRGFGNRCQHRLFPLHQYWYGAGREAIMVVVDSTSSMDDIKAACRKAGTEWVSRLLLFKDTVVMVVADKQEEEAAHSPDEIESALKEMALERWSDMTWLVSPCRGHTNDDVKPAYEYLRKMMRLKRKGQLTPGLINPTSHDASEQASQIVTEGEKDDIPDKESGNPKTADVFNFQEMGNSLKSHLSLISSTLSY